MISAKWVYSWKGNELGHVVRAKASLVARGFAQRESVDLRRSTSNFLVNSGFRYLFWMLICGGAFYLRKLGKSSICPVFNLRMPPKVGANRRVCILPAVLISKMTQTFI